LVRLIGFLIRATLNFPMALGAQIPPWLDINPTKDYVNAMSTGARLGLERSQLATSAQEAGDRLRYNYAQLASENERASQAQLLKERDRLDSLMQWHAENAQKEKSLDLAGKREERMGNAADALSNYRDDSLGLRDLAHQDLQRWRGQRADQFDRSMGLREQGEKRLEDTAAALKDWRGQTRLDKFDLAKYQAANHRVRSATGALLAALMNDDEKAATNARKELLAAQTELAQIEALMPQPGAQPAAGDALMGPASPTNLGTNAAPSATKRFRYNPTTKQLEPL
jgi:hypothetical protein